jgi:sRNA-binding carbon storage regulator CsrA
MLSLTRRRNQRIAICLDGGFLGWISVVDISQGRVNLGLEFPKTVHILRDDVMSPDEVIRCDKELEAKR